MFGTHEQMCAKLTEKTCLVPRSGEFECQDQRSKVKVTGTKKMRCVLPSPPGSDGMEHARCK